MMQLLSMKIKQAVAEAITAEAVKTAGYDSLEAAKEDRYSICIHGTWYFPYCKGKLQPDGCTDGKISGMTMYSSEP